MPKNTDDTRAPETPADSAAKAEAQAAEASAEVQERFDEANAKGYFGETPDPLPNSAHSLESGPDSPPLVDGDRVRFDQPALAPVKEA